jgi:hypothetical protein
MKNERIKMEWIAGYDPKHMNISRTVYKKVLKT